MYRVKPILGYTLSYKFMLQKRRFFIWWNLSWYFSRAEAERAAIHLESGTTSVLTD